MHYNLISILLIFNIIFSDSNIGKYLWPTDASETITTVFGDRRSKRFHAGIDVRTYGNIGDNLYAIESGYISRISINPTGYGKALYLKLEDACIELFKNTWPRICEGHFSKISQRLDVGTYHRTKDVKQIDRIDLDATYTAQNLIDLVRARTFPPYRGAYIETNGRKIFLRLELIYEENLQSKK